jgi:hypothetical protein
MDARRLRVAGVCWLVLSGVGAGASSWGWCPSGEVVDQAGAPVPGAISYRDRRRNAADAHGGADARGGLLDTVAAAGNLAREGRAERIQTIDPGRHPRRCSTPRS